MILVVRNLKFLCIDLIMFIRVFKNLVFILECKLSNFIIVNVIFFFYELNYFFL